MTELRDGYLVTDDPAVNLLFLHEKAEVRDSNNEWFERYVNGTDIQCVYRYTPSQVREAIKAVEGQAWFGVADHEPDYEDPTYGTDYADEAENKIGWTYLADNALTSNRTCGWLRKLWAFAMDADDDV